MPEGKTYNILSVAATPFFVDRGGHVHIYEQARALQKLGNRLTMVTYHLGRDMPDIDIRRIVNIPWYRKTDAGPSYQKIYLAKLLFFKSLRIAREIKPDVVHAHGWDSAWVAWWLWKFLGIPYIFDMQGSFSGEIVEHGYCVKGSLYYKFLRGIEGLTLNRSPVVVTSSTEICEQSRERFNLSPEHAWPILDGVDTDEFSPDVFQPDPALRAELGIPPGKQIIVYMGLLKTYQGIDDMIEAARVLVYERGYHNAHFLVLGFPDEERYAARAAERGLRNHMTFTGKIPYHETGRYMALADLAIAPKISMTEGDAKIYFYMAMGLPVVAYERPASLEILGDLGLYARFNDPNDLARAIHDALLQPESLRARGAANRQKAVRDYSWTAVARRIMDAYAIAQSRMMNRRRVQDSVRSPLKA
ncbi:MAG: glycosyltransferase family 4 protein [Chloroflexi bacterium]|nr:glycosyltransferase family 4 protein [Chloroflexota bacterium]